MQKTKKLPDLPNEVLVKIASVFFVDHNFDICSLLQFGLTCRKLHAISINPSIWKLICKRGIDDQYSQNKAKKIEWMDLYISSPHILFHGIYLAKYFYVRFGDYILSTSSHRIFRVDMFRYFRFFATGEVILCNTNEEPKYFPSIQSAYKMSGSEYSIGTFYLDGDLIRVNCGKQPESKQPRVFGYRLLRDITLKIVSTPTRPYSSLKWDKYSIAVIDPYDGTIGAPDEVNITNDCFPDCEFKVVHLESDENVAVS
ncbi:hypothetical protein ACOME3_006972 [Neoechinorhynchus agilis]